MLDNNDVYGRILKAYFQGDSVHEIIERDDGLITVTGGPAIYFETYDKWLPEEKEAIAYARGRTLDIGCGAGRHALYLQKSGLPVLGLDASPGALAVCRQRGLKETCLLPAAQVSSKTGRFEAILMMGNNFGLFANCRRGRWMLRRFKSMTTAEARLIVSTRDPYQTEDPIHLAYHRRNRDRGRMAGQVRIRLRYQNLKGPWFDYLMVSPEELLDFVAETGWQVSKLIKKSGPIYMAVLEKT